MICHCQRPKPFYDENENNNTFASIEKDRPLPMLTVSPEKGTKSVSKRGATLYFGIGLRFLIRSILAPNQGDLYKIIAFKEL